MEFIIIQCTKPFHSPDGLFCRAHPTGLTVPLLLTCAGEKIGKSAGNAVWLSPHKTSSYTLYQYFVKTADEDVEKLLKYFTFLPLQEIASIIEHHRVGEFMNPFFLSLLIPIHPSLQLPTSTFSFHLNSLFPSTSLLPCPPCLDAPRAADCTEGFG